MEDEPAKKMADGILKAMQAENEGKHFYLMAAQTTRDPKGREVFEQLAKEEEEHFQFLRSQYESVLKTGKPDVNLRLGPRTDLVGPNPIFSESLRSRIQDAHFEMTALSVGIQLELSAMNYYTKAAEEASDPTVQSFYRDLAEWESGHYNALLAQQEELKGDFWSSNRFAPF